MSSWCVVLDGSELPSREEIGGKAWSLARMRRLGLPCPPAFVLPTRVCREYDAGTELPPHVEDALRAGVAYLEAETGRRFGGGEQPLLLSVRSGAPVSMPGMMDTVLNLGFDDRVERALAAEAGDPAYASDTHSRFVASFGRIVLKADVEDDTRSPQELRQTVLAETGRPVPDDPWEQLREAVRAVLGSWQSRRAKAYRLHTGIPDDLGTAVTVQAMVFGNMGEDSGTGVLFSRDPMTGAAEPYGEYLPRGQGEDVVSGERTPLPLAHLAEQLPDVHRELLAAARRLEAEERDIQDIEFTVQGGTLYLLQTRAAKRSPEAAVRLAVDLVDEGLINEDEAVARVSAEQVRQLLRPRLDPGDRCDAIAVATGEAASPGAGAGLALSDADEVVERAARGESVVFLARTTSPEDVHAMIAAAAVCTETGGSTSHAAVVCRGLGRPAVVGCGPGVVDGLSGREVTVDGALGSVFDGLLPLRSVDPEGDDRLRRLTAWAAAATHVDVVTSTADGDIRDLDELGVVEVAGVEHAVAGATAVRGGVVETDAGVAAAIRGGVRRIVTDRPLPVLLAAAAQQRAADARSPLAELGARSAG
ncbi:pyruvate, phosphate dikinase [Pseudonocardia acidicola]|uniref:Pyruvate, phosphate dikinase n=1 Tax=Pseudonocardia acidicola TaxID=2724939 RepID=A0ABX1SDP8_9PSEU|nr:pyruvate, phosphate dikinase [Pseudonocardia acidicola]NMH98613.1 pyruvate, phosphate dikinase [Pseudonocardia acidicola]